MALYDGISLFEPRTLSKVVVQLPPKIGLFQQLFFSKREPYDTKAVDVHVRVKGRRLLPHVSEGAPATVVQRKGFKVISVTPPRFRPKVPYRAADLLFKMQAGQTPYDAATAQTRIERAIALDLEDLRDDHDTTLEFMASRVPTGVLDIVQTDGPDYSMDFLMPPDNKVVLSGDARWGESGANSRKNMENWSMLMQVASGYGCTDMLCGDNAWDRFYYDVKDDLDTRNLNVGSISSDVESKFKGRVHGVNIWAEGTTVPDWEGVDTALVDTDHVVLGNRFAPHEVSYGLPEDLANNGAPNMMFVKPDLKEDPSSLDIIMETNPLPWSMLPGAWVYAKVCN